MGISFMSHKITQAQYGGQLKEEQGQKSGGWHGALLVLQREKGLGRGWCWAWYGSAKASAYGAYVLEGLPDRITIHNTIKFQVGSKSCDKN